MCTGGPQPQGAGAARCQGSADARLAAAGEESKKEGSNDTIRDIVGKAASLTIPTHILNCFATFYLPSFAAVQLVCFATFCLPFLAAVQLACYATICLSFLAVVQLHGAAVSGTAVLPGSSAPCNRHRGRPGSRSACEGGAACGAGPGAGPYGRVTGVCMCVHVCTCTCLSVCVCVCVCVSSTHPHTDTHKHSVCACLHLPIS
jgi:hypothetical protein